MYVYARTNELMILFSSRSSVRNKTVQSESLRSKQHMSRIKWTGRVHVRAGIPWITTPLPARVHSQFRLSAKRSLRQSEMQRSLPWYMRHSSQMCSRQP